MWRNNRTCLAAHMISASKYVFGGKLASWRNIAIFHTDPESIEDYSVSQCCVIFSPPHCRSRHTCLPYQVIRPLSRILTTVFHRISHLCTHTHAYSLENAFQHPYRHIVIDGLYKRALVVCENASAPLLCYKITPKLVQKIMILDAEKSLSKIIIKNNNNNSANTLYVHHSSATDNNHLSIITSSFRHTCFKSVCQYCL